MKRNGKPKVVRVAIYCRQSVDKGADQTLTSCEAQRQVVQSYIATHRAQGWIALDETFDDAGYSGSNTDRPAFRRLMQRIEQGAIDVVATYRLDRVSRSLADFSAFMKRLDECNVRFIASSQSFDTTTITGKLMVGIVASFSEYERQVIAERIKDKLVAARKSGHWGAGGAPFGYRFENRKLTVDENEAPVVKLIFSTYLRLRSLSLVATELKRRAITSRTGRHWTPTALSRVLRSVPVTGRVPLGQESFEGKHERIIDDQTFEAAQALLAKNGQQKGTDLRNKHHVLLRGLLHCAQCSRVMIHTYSSDRRRLHH